MAKEPDQLDLMLSKHLKRLGIPKKQWPEAKQSLLDFGKNVLAIESTNDYNAINKKSGAKGGYQFLDNSIAPAITRLRRDIEPQDWMDEVSKNKDARTLTPEQQDLLVYGDLLNKTVGGEVGRGDRYLKGIIGGDKESALRMYYEGHHTDPESQKGTTARARAQFGLPVENNRSGGIVSNMNMQYEKGGMVNQAKGLASFGRGEDTELIHMTPSEINGLQSLAVRMGGSLATNPTTGLPEAGFFKNILPMLVGGALSLTGVGALGVGAMMGGGALAASGGDLKQAVKWGLGGASGAGIANSLAGAGAGVQAGAAGTAGTTNAANAARGGMSQLKDIGQALADPSKLTNATSGFMAQPFAKSQLYSGLGSLAVGNEIDRAKLDGEPPKAQEDLHYFPEGGYRYDENNNVVQANPNARNMFNAEGRYDWGAGYPTSNAAQGGLMGFADGGLTAGPGDGMSDEIMTSISGQQPAALSPGEFVVPADVVSGLGNGSTQAGANALDDMMERVRKARGGSALQPPALNAQDMMPA